MSSLLLMNVFDAALALGEDPLSATPDSVADWIRKNYLVPRITTYNYDLPIRLLADGFRGAVSTERAISTVMTQGHPLARSQFCGVIRALWPYVEEHRSSVYPLGFLAAPVGLVGGERVHLSTKAPIVRVERGKPLLVMPQMRRSARPVRRQVDVVLTFAREQALREGYRTVDVEFLEAVPVGKGVERFARVSLASTRELFEADALDHMLQTFVAGIALLRGAGVSMGRPNFSGYRVIDPDQPGFPF
jgi:hypothetical protein